MRIRAVQKPAQMARSGHDTALHRPSGRQTRSTRDRGLVYASRMVHPLAGQPAPRSLLVNVPRLISAYYTGRPDPSVPAQRVAFGTSGHRGSSLHDAFNEAHIAAIAQAV